METFFLIVNEIDLQQLICVCVCSFIRKSINHGYKPTIGADFNSKKLQMPVGDEIVSVTLQLWDTAGQERY